jgi:hypothetical protein
MRNPIGSIWLRVFATLAAVALVTSNADLARAQVDCTVEHEGKYCSKTARAACIACRNDVGDGFWSEIARCLNLSDPLDRVDCRAGAREARDEDSAECEDQLEARVAVCGLVGEERYDEAFDAADFVDPDAIGATVTPNPFFPLLVGNQWVYEGDDQVITVDVTNESKLIEDVTCRVVRKTVEEDDVVIEVTDEWFAQDNDGNVWTCGELTQEFELFDGDDPAEPELTGAGGFKVGEDGAKPGIFMLANPQVGDAHRQEAAFGDAEDVTEVTSTTGTETVPATSCTGDCLVTREFSALDLGDDVNNYYKSGVGLILSVLIDGGDRVELVEFTTPTP